MRFLTFGDHHHLRVNSPSERTRKEDKTGGKGEGMRKGKKRRKERNKGREKKIEERKKGEGDLIRTWAGVFLWASAMETICGLS